MTFGLETLTPTRFSLSAALGSPGCVLFDDLYRPIVASVDCSQGPDHRPDPYLKPLLPGAKVRGTAEGVGEVRVTGEDYGKINVQIRVGRQKVTPSLRGAIGDGSTLLGRL